jgi:hypothetical protein
MARLAPSEVAEVLERFLTLRPWVRPLAGIAAPGRIVPFVRHQLGDVRVDDPGWIATAEWEGIAVTGTPRVGVLAQPAVIPWGDVARFRHRISPRCIGLSAPPDGVQRDLF